MIRARMKRVLVILVPILIALGLVVLFWFLVDGKRIDVLQPAGEVASAQKGIFALTVFLSALVVVPVFVMLAFFSLRYRKGNKKASYRPEWGENKWLEGLWWGVPILIIGILGVVTYQTSHSLDPYKERAGGEPLDVQVVALRWKWLFIYPDQQVATLNHLPLPVDRPVRFSMTADAPMSAFWIPSLGSQTYAMNGMASKLNLKADEVGEYTGYTTNINGEGYAKMTFQAKVMTQDDFASWTETAKVSEEPMNMAEYEALAEPGSQTDQRTYRLANAKLFDMIMEKFGHGAHHGAHS
jgi:cytochrome o ubiquinol oxidase subunit II